MTILTRFIGAILLTAAACSSGDDVKAYPLTAAQIAEAKASADPVPPLYAPITDADLEAVCRNFEAANWDYTNMSGDVYLARVVLEVLFVLWEIIEYASDADDNGLLKGFCQ